MKIQKQMITFTLLTALCLGSTAKGDSSSYAQWENGPPSDPDYFPIAVWLQQPKYAEQYRKAGFNIYKGLWKGPTEAQLATLKKAGMPVICDQNEVGLKHIDDPTIIGWMHSDEPDNAQKIENWKSADEIRKVWPNLPDNYLNMTLEQWGKYGPPFSPLQTQNVYREIKKNDPSRPVFLGIGQGTAWDNWVGRGARRNQPHDYPQYVKGCDVVGFDIYPIGHTSPEVNGKLEYITKGILRLKKWSKGKKIVWNTICTSTSHSGKETPTPRQYRSMVWMSIINGSRGLLIFVHQMKPKLIETALLEDAEMLAAVTKTHKQIHSLAAVINSPDVAGLVSVKSSNAAVPVKIMTKQHNGATYIFAAGMKTGDTEATFTVKGCADTAEVLGEDRKIAVAGKKFTDTFKDYGVHIYRIK